MFNAKQLELNAEPKIKVLNEKGGQKDEDITNPRRCLFCQAIFSLEKCLFKVIISRNYIIMIEKKNSVSANTKTDKIFRINLARLGFLSPNNSQSPVTLNTAFVSNCKNSMRKIAIDL